jgi:two-component system, NarL family, sensor histidine kinase UhpB
VKTKPATSVAAAKLRRRAEAHLQKRQRTQRSASKGQRPTVDTQRLVHELEVHQIELEMQNEELTQTNAQTEAVAKKFTTLYDFAPLGYVTLDDSSRIQKLNFTAAKLLGQSRAALCGTLFVHSVAPQDRDAFRQHLQTASESATQVTAEIDLCSEDRRTVPVQLCTIWHRDGPGQPRHYLTAITDLTERKRVEEEVCRLNEELEERIQQRTATIRKLATELTLTEQREKTCLSMVLHDHVQQLLVAARYLLDRVERTSRESQRKTVHEVKDLLVESMDELRTLSVELSPPVLRERGLVAALIWLGDWMQNKHGLTVKVTFGPNQIPMREVVSILLYQSIRELLFNAVKHAQVNSASVAIGWLDKSVRIVVSDKGKGFSAARIQRATSSANRFGLIAVRDRLALLGGRMEMESAPGQGSRFTLWVPLGRPVASKTRCKTKIVL